MSLKTDDNTIQIDFICKKGNNNLEIQKQEMSQNGLTRIYTIEHKKGCPVFNVSSMARFIAKHSHLFGAVFIVIGGFLCLFGKAMLGLAIFMISASTTFLIGTFMTFNGFDYFDWTPSNAVFWTVIGLWAVTGLLVGTAFYKLQKYGVIIMGLVTGALIGHIIVTIAHLDDTLIYWGVIAGSALSFFIFSCFCQNNIRIFITSFIGSYAVTRGIGSYLGGFPDENELQKEMHNGKFHFKKFPKSFYVYFVSFVVLILISCLFQRWMLKKYGK